MKFPLFVIHKLLGFALEDEDGTSRIPWIRDGLITSVGAMLAPLNREDSVAAMSPNDPGIAGIFRTQQMYVEHLATCKE